jgi:hypothetical protein
LRDWTSEKKTKKNHIMKKKEKQQQGRLALRAALTFAFSAYAAKLVCGFFRNDAGMSFSELSLRDENASSCAHSNLVSRATSAAPHTHTHTISTTNKRPRTPSPSLDTASKFGRTAVLAACTGPEPGTAAARRVKMRVTEALATF